MAPLFHIALRRDWQQARERGAYRVSTLGKRLDQEGFIHLSFAHQVKLVADAMYAGRTDLVLLELDPARLRAPIRVQPVPGSEQQFPHLYGEVDLDAVVMVHALQPRLDGTFDPIG